MTIAGAIHVRPGALRLVASANIRTPQFEKGKREKGVSYHYWLPLRLQRLPIRNKARGRRGRKNVLVSVEGWNNCRGAWLPCQASLILGASQPRVWNHRNAPINLILPFASIRLYSSLLAPPRRSPCSVLRFFVDSLAFAQLNTISYIRVLGEPRIYTAIVLWYFQFLRQSQPHRIFIRWCDGSFSKTPLWIVEKLRTYRY